MRTSEFRKFCIRILRENEIVRVGPGMYVVVESVEHEYIGRKSCDMVYLHNVYHALFKLDRLGC